MKISYLLLIILSFPIIFIPILYSDSFPVDDYDQFLKKYGYLEDYYKRWQNFVPERDYPDDKEVNYYLKLEKEGKLPKNFTIYHNENDAIPAYREFLVSQPKSLKEIYEDLKIYHPAILSERYNVVPEADDFAKYISIPKIDYLLWMMKDLSKTHPRYQRPYELCVMGDWMIRRSICFSKEIEYYRKNVLPIFRGMVLSGSFNTYILKVIYLFGEKDILPVAFEAAKSDGIAITMWGREYLSFKRKIRVTERPLEFKPFIINLLSNEHPINEGSQYDFVLWLYWAGELPNHRDLLIRILENGWFGIHYNDPSRYLGFLWNIKDKRIYEYLKKNLDNPNLLKSDRSKIIDYIEAYEKNEK